MPNVLPPLTVLGNPSGDDEPASAVPFAMLAAFALGLLTDVSTSSVTIAGSGNLTFQCSQNKAFQPGMPMTISNALNAAQYVAGVVVSYNSVTGVLILGANTSAGSGTLSNWLVSMGAPGPAGAVGPTGTLGVEPQGRLTLVSNTPVMTSDQAGVSTVYYTPYKGQIVPLYNGASWAGFDFTQMSVALDNTNWTSGNLYDFFVFSNNGTPTLGYGPAWTSATARSAAIQQLNGTWVNSAQITLRTSSSQTYVVSANQATYVGTGLASANGQITMQMNPSAASDGSNPIMGLWNAYNRVRTDCNNEDSTPSWTYSSATWRHANGQSTNRIRYVDGLGQSPVVGNYGCIVASGTSMNPSVGLERDWSSGAPSGSCPSMAGASTASLLAQNNWSPAMGLHEIDAVETDNGTTASTFYGALTSGQQCMRLQISLEM